MKKITDYCTNCLTESLQIKGLCEGENCADFYLNDFVDVSVKDLANTANESELSGMAFGKQLIRRAGVKLMGAIQTLIPSNYSVNKAINSICSMCDFNSLTGTGSVGITIQNTSDSIGNFTQITSLKISTTTIGPEVIIIDDGVNPMFLPITLNGGVQQLEITNYETNQNLIKVYFQNPLVVLNMVNCPVESNCGCGRSVESTAKNFQIKGLLDGNIVVTQYGFMPCITTSCNFDYMMCEIAKTNKQLIAYAMALLIQKDYLDRLLTTDRLNKKTIMADSATVSDYRDMADKKYNEVVYGSLDGYGKPAKAGIKQIIEDNLKNKKDSCIMCTSLNYYASPAI